MFSLLKAFFRGFDQLPVAVFVLLVMDVREVDVRKDRRRCRAADVTQAGVILVCHSIDSPASSATSPSTLTLLPFLSLLPPSLPPSVFPFTLFSIPTLLALSPPFLLPDSLNTSPCLLHKTILACSPSIPTTSPTFIMGLPSLTDWPLSPLFLHNSPPSPL